MPAQDSGDLAQYVVVTTTTDSEEAARALAAGAVEARLGACAQVVPITSVYRWEGEVHNDPEWRVDIKTAADRAERLVAHLKATHSYDVPEVIITPITGGNSDYLSWLVDETRENRG